MPKTNLVDEYLNIQKEYISKYGEKTLVLMEVGSFYELYAVNETQLEHLKNACQLTALRISRKNNKTDDLKVSSGNPYMAGFTNIAFAKYMKILVNHNYTIVKIDQVTPPPNPKREVTRIFSPGTFWDTDDTRDHCFIMGIYIEGHIQLNNNKKLYSIGLSLIDLSTGDSNVIELHDNNNSTNQLGVLTEMYRLVYNYQPVEIIIAHQDADEIVTLVNDKLLSQFDKFHNMGKINDKFTKPCYQDNFLRKYFPCTSSVSPIDFIGLGMYNMCLISYLLLLDFTYQHDTILIKSLPKPSILSDNCLLNISYQSLETLDILSYDKKRKTLGKLLNLCTTLPGKRKFKYSLHHPITDINELENRYTKTESISDTYESYEKKLKDTHDIHRLHRKLLINNNVKPYEFYLIHTTYEAIYDIIQTLDKHNIKSIFLKHLDVYKDFLKLRRKYLETFDIHKLNKFNTFNDINENIFQKGKCETIDTLFIKRATIYNEIIDFKNKLCVLTKDSKKRDEDIINNIKIDNNEKDGYFMKLTKTKYKQLKKSLSDDSKTKIVFKDKYDYLERLKFKEKSTEVNINSVDISKISDKLIGIDLMIRDKTKHFFMKKIIEWFDQYPVVLQWTNQFLADIDNTIASAKMASLFNYCKPSISKKYSESGIKATDIRHPILERLNTRNVLVSNDIDIGSLGEKNGMLITGLNGVGKSIYIKSIALCIVLAQAGYYVPATTFEYIPYHNLFTRIGNVDNLFKGQSTFYCEMLELDEILRNCNSKSLVIADELCSGSEQFSAQSILASTIIELKNQNSNFMLTTHFHRSLEIPEVVNLDNTEFYHFSIQYDKDNQSIIYDRKLKKGVGEKLYGIEVCQNIIQNKGFINRCFNIRNNIIEESKVTHEKQNLIKTSAYNSSLVVEKCEICNKRNIPDGTLHTHHIQEQHCANKNGYILSYHKNNIDNLVVLCNKHHHEVHHGNLVIKGWIELADKGKKLDYYYKTEKKSEKKISKRKYSNKDIETIISIKVTVGSRSKSAKLLLEKNHGFKKISESTIKKIWNNTYIES